MSTWLALQNDPATTAAIKSGSLRLSVAGVEAKYPPPAAGTWASEEVEVVHSNNADYWIRIRPAVIDGTETRVSFDWADAQGAGTMVTAAIAIDAAPPGSFVPQSVPEPGVWAALVPVLVLAWISNCRAFAARDERGEGEA